MEGQLWTVCRVLSLRWPDLCSLATKASLQMWVKGGALKVSLMKRLSEYQAHNHTSLPSRHCPLPWKKDKTQRKSNPLDTFYVPSLPGFTSIFLEELSMLIYQRRKGSSERLRNLPAVTWVEASLRREK